MSLQKLLPLIDDTSETRQRVSKFSMSSLISDVEEKKLTLVEKTIILRVSNILHGQKKLVLYKKFRCCFTRWRFYVENNIGPAIISKQSNAQHIANAIESLAENERLRAELKEETRIYTEKMYKVTHIGGARMMITFWKCRILRKLGAAFQRWCLGIQHLENLRKLDGLNDSVGSGHQELIQRKQKVKDIEETNSRLQLSLLVVLSVLRLRSHSFLVSLASARKQSANQRTHLWNELTSMKAALNKYNVEDVMATSTARERGKEYLRALDDIKKNIDSALLTQNALQHEFDELTKKQQDLYTNKELLAQKSGVYLADNMKASVIVNKR
jgi:hypothetical protein